MRGTGLLRTRVEQSLAELVACGAVTADSFSGMRALLTPSDRRPPLGRGRRRGRHAVFGMQNAGRWSLLDAQEDGERAADSDAALERVAWTLLLRLGVVFRGILERETLAPGRFLAAVRVQPQRRDVTCARERSVLQRGRCGRHRGRNRRPGSRPGAGGAPSYRPRPAGG